MAIVIRGLTAPGGWEINATNFFVVGRGYYKLIPVLDDFSKKIVAEDLKPDESGYSIADVVELAIEKARAEGHLGAVRCRSSIRTTGQALRQSLLTST